MKKFDSRLEKDFYDLWCVGRPKPTTQHKFHPKRQWRFDFCWIEQKVAVEIQGFGEGHNSYDGMKTDYEKHNEAVLMGWTVLFFMRHDIKKPHYQERMLRQICEALNHEYHPNANQGFFLLDEARRRAIEEHNRRKH